MILELIIRNTVKCTQMEGFCLKNGTDVSPDYTIHVNLPQPKGFTFERQQNVRVLLTCICGQTAPHCVHTSTLHSEYERV